MTQAIITLTDTKPGEFNVLVEFSPKGTDPESKAHMAAVHMLSELKEITQPEGARP